MKKALVVLLFSLAAYATTVSGTFSFAGLAAIANGRVAFTLLTPGNHAVQQISTGKIIQPGVVAVTNLDGSGSFSGVTIVGNDDIAQPYTYYQMDVYDSQGVKQGVQYFSVTGTTFSVNSIPAANLAAGKPSRAAPVVTIFIWPTVNHLVN